MRVKCTVCGKSFNYGDENSPMFKDNIWNDIVNHFGLSGFEKEAAKRFYSSVKSGDRSYKEDCHVFICSECAESALGRKITAEDINDSPFNRPFREVYLGE